MNKKAGEMGAEWNANLYDAKHDFVWKYGADVVSLLDPRPGERILDLGCGTGHLTAQIAESGAKVLGVDRSAEMVAAARLAYPNLEFEISDFRFRPAASDVESISDLIRISDFGFRIFPHAFSGRCDSTNRTWLAASSPKRKRRRSIRRSTSN